MGVEKEEGIDHVLSFTTASEVALFTKVNYIISGMIGVNAIIGRGVLFFYSFCFFSFYCFCSQRRLANYSRLHTIQILP